MWMYRIHKVIFPGLEGLQPSYTRGPIFNWATKYLGIRRDLFLLKIFSTEHGDSSESCDKSLFDFEVKGFVFAVCEEVEPCAPLKVDVSEILLDETSAFDMCQSTKQKTDTSVNPIGNWRFLLVEFDIPEPKRTHFFPCKCWETKMKHLAFTYIIPGTWEGNPAQIPPQFQASNKQKQRRS